MDESFTFLPQEVPSTRKSKYVEFIEEVINHSAPSGMIGIPSGVRIDTAYNNFNKIIKDKYPDRGITLHKRGDCLYIKK